MANYNYNNGSNYQKNDNNSNNNYPDNNYTSYPPNGGMYYNAPPKIKNNTPLIVLSIVMACVAIIASITAVALYFNNSSDNTASSDRPVKYESELNPENSVNQIEPVDNLTQNDYAATPQKEPEIIVPKTMYVDCNTTLTLREGPGTNYPEILSIPAGDVLEYYKDAGNNFAKVVYNGIDGYVSKDYLSYTRPYVWDYNEAEVKDFVKEVLYAFVTSVNRDDVTYLTQYLSGTAISDAQKSHNEVQQVTDREEVVSVNCHSVKRVGKNKVTVVRESVIRVYRHNGEVKDVSEKYLTTVENTSNGMKVVKFTKMK